LRKEKGDAGLRPSSEGGKKKGDDFFCLPEEDLRDKAPFSRCEEGGRKNGKSPRGKKASSRKRERPVLSTTGGKRKKGGQLLARGRAAGAGEEKDKGLPFIMGERKKKKIEGLPLLIAGCGARKRKKKFSGARREKKNLDALDARRASTRKGKGGDKPQEKEDRPARFSMEDTQEREKGGKKRIEQLECLALQQEKGQQAIRERRARTPSLIWRKEKKKRRGRRFLGQRRIIKGGGGHHLDKKNLGKRGEASPGGKEGGGGTSPCTCLTARGERKPGGREKNADLYLGKRERMISPQFMAELST